jgi:hypothetical protein
MDIKKRYKKREIVQKTLIVQKTHRFNGGFQRQFEW